MSPAVAQSYPAASGGMGGSLGSLLNKVSKGGGGFLGGGAAGAGGGSTPAQWDSYRIQAPSPARSNGRAPQGHVGETAVGAVVSGPGSPAASSSSRSSPYPSQSPSSEQAYTRAFPPPLQPRDYTVLKEVGDGSFGTVWLADWHSPLYLPPGTLPPGPSSRPEYKGKQLVAVKRMKKAFEGGWEECMKLKELKSLRQIPMHPNIIPLYDAFLLPSTRELYFVFECMEGNLYQLTKSRKGRPLAAGLTASIFYQILAGLDHIHRSGYFHRDMKPENLLITTTGLADYPASSLYAVPGTPPEKDVVVVVKLADFGLAREINSRPPYTEYVSTRWYRAPEVLLRSRDYSVPVDMWALGTIMVETITLKPLFPGDSEVDQIHRICQILGDPSSDYGADDRGRVKGGGPWVKGSKMAKDVGFAFPKMPPRSWTAHFDMNTVSIQLIDCIADLLRFEPKARLTAQQCLDSAYFRDIAPRFAAYEAAPSTPSSSVFPSSSSSTSTARSRDLPPPHNHSTPAYYKPPFQPDSTYGVQTGAIQYDSTMLAFPEPVGDRTEQFPSPTPSSIWNGHHVDPTWGRTPAQQQQQQRQQPQQMYDEPGQRTIPAFGSHVRRGSYSNSIAPSIAASTFYDGSIFEGIAPTRGTSIMSFPVSYSGILDDNAPNQGFGGSPTMMYRDGSQDSAPAIIVGGQGPAQENPQASTSKGGRGWGFFGGDKASSSNQSSSGLQASGNPLKRTPSITSTNHPSESDSRSPLDQKKAKKEAEKAAKEAERLKREMLQSASRERARAVMKKKSQLMEAADPLHNFSNHTRTVAVDKGKARASAQSSASQRARASDMPQIVEDTSKLYVSGDPRYKARRKDDDDDVHSISSNDTGHSSQRGRPFSISSQATSASDPERRHPWPDSEPNGATSLPSIHSNSSRPSHGSHYYSAAPNTGHSSLDLATRMQGLATSSSERSDSRGHRAGSPAGGSDRFSPYNFQRASGQSLPPIHSFDAHSHQGHAAQASVATYHSAPGVLSSHHRYQPSADGPGGPQLAPFLATTQEATPPTGSGAQFPSPGAPASNT